MLMNPDHRHRPDSGNRTKSRAKWAFIGFAAIAAYFLITEHQAHLSGWLASYWSMYVRLARREECEVAAEFGEEYARYAARTPAFLPRLGALLTRARDNSS